MNKIDNQLPLFGENNEKTELLKLSTSKVKMFSHCAAQYKFNYIERLPKKDWEHHSFGLFLHAVLENFHMEYINGCIEPYSKTMTRIYKIVLKQYKEKLTSELKKEAYQIVEQYLQKLCTDKKAVKNVISVEKRFNIQISDRIILTGSIDKVLRDDDNILWVQDYKTVKNKKYLKNDFLQLKTYAYALYTEDRTIKKIKASYVLLRHDFELISTEFNLEEIKDIENQYKEYADKINQEKLYRPNPGILCKYCDFLESCKQGQAFVNRNTQKHGEVEW